MRGLARDPGVEVAARQAQGPERLCQHVGRAGFLALPMRPGDGRVRGAREDHLVARTIHLGQHDGAGAGRQLGQAARDRGQCGVVADQQVPVEIGRDDEGAARPADLERLPAPHLLGPACRRSGVVQNELDVERVGGRIIAARRVVARRHRRLAVGARRPVRKEQLDMVIEPEAGEAFEIAAERDADHVRRDLVDALDLEPASARLMTNAARRARRGIEFLYRNRRRCRHIENLQRLRRCVEHVRDCVASAKCPRFERF